MALNADPSLAPLIREGGAPVQADALEQLFSGARTANSWRPRPVPEALLRQVYDLARLGPTSANVSPARFVFLTTAEAKARIAPHLSKANRDKSLAAPVIAIVAYDLDFADKLPKLFPHNPGAKAWFADPEVAAITAIRNGTLQGAYLMLAARALGLDCGPMSGFDQAGVDREFFPEGRTVTNFLVNLGYAEPAQFPRLPRLAFEEACSLV